MDHPDQPPPRGGGSGRGDTHHVWLRLVVASRLRSTPCALAPSRELLPIASPGLSTSVKAATYRVSGVGAVLLTLPIAFPWLWSLGFGSYSTRVLVTG